MKYLTPNWPAPKNIKAYTTLKDAWHPMPDRTGLKNVSDLQTAALKKLLVMPNDPIWLTQIHGTQAVLACKSNECAEADASFTQEHHQVCAILTADCLPILVCNRAGTHVAAIHAGWRGLSHGVIESTLAQLNLPMNELLVWLGPAIGPLKFEVGDEVFQAFTHNQPEAKAAFKQKQPHKWLGNLYALAALRLTRLGVTNLYGGQYCTYTQDALFFSYRRDKACTGRMASVIWIEPI